MQALIDWLFLDLATRSGDVGLKPNMPIMLLRNLDPHAGLCNGTRLVVKRVINGHLLEAKIVSAGEHHGDIVYIPRMKLSDEEGARVQFPVRRA